MCRDRKLRLAGSEVMGCVWLFLWRGWDEMSAGVRRSSKACCITSPPAVREVEHRYEELGRDALNFNGEERVAVQGVCVWGTGRR